jgi:hypothetical protein
MIFGRCLALCSLLFVSTSTSAEEVTVPVDAPFSAASAVGLVVSSSGTVEKLNPKITSDGPTRLLVTFDVPSSEISDDTVATAIVRSSNGATAFGQVTVLATDGTGKSKVPHCKEGEIDRYEVANQGGVLASLVDIRNARREVARSKLQAFFSPEALAKYHTIEEGFGLKSLTPLDAEPAPYHLANRLARLLLAVQSYRALQGQREDAQPEGE